MKRLFLGLFFVSLFTSLGYSIGAPGKITILIDAGTSWEGTIPVLESSGTQITGGISDFDARPDGTPEFYQANTTPWSCASWISTEPKEFVIPETGSRDITVRVNVPPKARGGNYAYLYFQTVPPPDAGAIATALRIGTYVFVEVRGTQRYKAGYSQIKYLSSPTLKQKLNKDLVYGLSVTVDNCSNVLIRPKGTAEIYPYSLGKKPSQRGEPTEIIQLNPDAFALMPGVKREYIIEGKTSLEPQKRYIAYFTFVCGEGEKLQQVKKRLVFIAQ